MKEFKVTSNIGAGLFSDEAVGVLLRFPDGSRAELYLHALTQDVLVELHKAGVKFEAYKTPEDALANSRAIIERIVRNGTWHPVDGEPVEITDENKHRIVSNVGLTTATINAARALAEERVEEEEGNSASSSGGSSPRTGGNTGDMSSAPTGKLN